VAGDQNLNIIPEGRPSRRVLIWGLAIFLLALALRFINQWEVKDHPLTRQLFLDPALYDRWAQAIAAGDWLSRAQGIFYANPLYPYFLAAIYSVLGHSILAVAIVQSILGSGLCLMLFLIGRRVFGHACGVLAGLMAALYAPFIFYESTVKIATLGLFLSALSILVLITGPRPGPGRSLAGGLVWGLRALARLDATVLAAIAWLLGAKDGGRLRRRISLALLFCLGVMVVILPVTVRNVVVGGKFVLITAHGGETFYAGNNPLATGIYSPAPGVRPGTDYEHEDFRRLASQRAGRELTLAESSGYWLHQALDDIRSHPGQWLRLEGRKLLLFWRSWEIPDNRDFHYFKKCSQVLRLPLFNFAIVAPLALLGLAVGVRTWRRSFLLYLQVFFSMLSVLLFFVSSRYRLPTVPFLIVFAAYGLVWSFGKLKKRRWALLVVCWLPTATLLVLLGGEAHRRDQGPFLARQETFGVALIREGRVDEGIAQLQDVVRQGPERITAHFNLGVAYLEEKNQTSKAAREFRAVVRLQQDYPEAHRMLARVYWQMDRKPEALQEWGQELVLWPGNTPARLELAMALVETERWAEAQEQFQYIIRKNPEQPEILRSLGNVLYLQGKLEKAVDAWQQALEMDPADEGLKENLAKLREQIERRNVER